jgi:outer membrane protein OmpA-like peptidoglycan-associated protein
VPQHLTYEVGLGLHFATSLLTRTSDGADVVGWRAQGEVLAALGLFEWMELGVAVPVALSSVATDSQAVLDPSQPIGRSTEVSPGDVRLSAKVPLLRGDFALAAQLVSSVPSGDGSEYAGAELWTTTPGLVAAYRVGAVTFAGEASYRFRRRATFGNLEFDDELHVALGGRVEVMDGLSLLAETQLRVGTGGRSLDGNEVPMEVDAGLRWQPVRGLTVDVGGGTGVLDGYGAPTGRAFVLLRYASEREGCEAGPEDFDGFEDGDFCADPDNDADGIPDETDDCPNNPEDRDEFLDADGCPDRDNDADGVLDDADECPVESEDRDGWQDEDGCADRDNDEDGIPDGVDVCPMEPEDRDDYEDDDGCPEPGPEQATVTVTDSRILISERIYFDFDTDTIRSVSRPLLDQVAGVIKDIPRRRRIRVEGYSDSEGLDEYNLDLSYRRARAVVEYLVSQGVPRERFEYVGYGEKNSVAPNDSPEGRALNRRVEFTILEPGEGRRKAR